MDSSSPATARASLPRVLVLPVRTLRGLSVPETPFSGLGIDGQPVPQGVQVDLVGMLGHEFDTDAHFAPYFVQDEKGTIGDQCPRLRLEALPQIQALGAQVLCSAAAVDLDLQDLFEPKRKG